MKTLKSGLLALIALVMLSLITQCKKDEACKEKHIKDCYSTEQYDPVCGCNGKTYGNSSQAACYSITEFTPGECN
ncbi:MAG: hypothetical protein H0X62_14370 [Bacteroidetes bacterium]|nr:hypothetical protein [Bacteroidota bacterium]